jgi:hypothetical protein
MNPTFAPFQSALRPDLTLKRRVNSTPSIPLEPDDIVPVERRKAGPYGQASLQEAWDKLYRARALLEAEQAHLRDDRITMQGERDSIDARERALAARETRLLQMENEAAFERAEAECAKDSESAIMRLTKAPFRSVFGQKK